MFMSEEKLTIEVAQIDGIKIDDMDLAEACEDKVFEQLASDSTSTHHQYAGLERSCQLHVGRAKACAWSRRETRQESQL
jgi:hypothetical protein